MVYGVSYEFVNNWRYLALVEPDTGIPEFSFYFQFDLIVGGMFS